MIVGDNQDYDLSDGMQRCRDYIDALNGERMKILVFRRELPLCLELVTQAIGAWEEKLSERMNGQSECNSEQTSSDGPGFEEFIPVKRDSGLDDDDDDDDDDDEDEEESRKLKSDDEKLDWLGSARLSLSNQSSDLVGSKVKVKVKVPATEVKSGGAFHPFKRERNDETSPTPMALPSPADAVAAKGKRDKDEQGQRKSRRCWSPELHRRFLLALQQLGGSHVATPKQIRDLMKVDGLTNDEVKSHLQKYRLHSRRPTPSTSTAAAATNNNPQAPQFLVVGGIWVPPPDYISTHPSPLTTTTRNCVYAPIATPALPRQRQQLNNPSRSSLSNVSNSPANSSSTRTTTS